MFGGKAFFVKYLYKKMLVKDMGSVYKTCFIAWGRGSPRPNTLRVRAGSLVFNISCAVSSKSISSAAALWTETSDKPSGEEGRAGRWEICLKILLNTPFC